MRKELSRTILIVLIFLVIGIFIGISLTNLTPPTTTTTTTTNIDCSTMNPNYCDTDDDCVCDCIGRFRGNIDYDNYCVNKTTFPAGACQMNYCLFAPGEGMICVNHTCQIGTK
jgi:hypothetical protein